MANVLISDLTADTSPSGTDLVETLKDPAGSPSSRKVELVRLGGLALLEQHAASGSASLDFTTCITSAYNTYLFDIENMIAAAGNANLVMRMSIDGGSTWLTTGYAWSLLYVSSGSGSGVQAGGTTNVRLNENYTSTTTANGGVTGSVFLRNPLSTSYAKHLTFQSNNINGADGGLYQSIGGGWNSTMSAVNAVQFKMEDADGTARNTAGGTIRAYGLRP